MPAFRYIAASTDQSPHQWWPWPTPPLGDLPTGPGTRRPFPMTVEQAVELWWRVTRFSCTYEETGRYYAIAPDSLCPNGTYSEWSYPLQTLSCVLPPLFVDVVNESYQLESYDWEGAFRGWDEEGSVQGTVTGYGCDGQLTNSGPTGAFGLRVQLGGDPEYEFVAPFSVDNSGQFWPTLHISVGSVVLVTAADEFNRHIETSLILPSGVFPITLGYSSLGGLDYTDVNVGPITATGFRPYDPGDGGGPIWHPTTGEQLRDPFSVQ